MHGFKPTHTRGRMRAFKGTGKARYLKEDVIYEARPIDIDGTLGIIDEDNDTWELEVDVSQLIRLRLIEEVKRPPMEENE